MARLGHFDRRFQNDPRGGCRLTSDPSYFAYVFGAISCPKEATMRNLRFTAVIGLLFCTFYGALSAQSDSHVIAQLKETHWTAAPPMLPAGAEIAVLAGNPTQAEAYTIRLKFPAGYAIPPHSHPTDENVVVVAGALTFGMGGKLMRNGAGNKTLTAGGFALMPAGMDHYAFTTTQETTLVLYGQGPVEFKYVNPTDDPRNGSGAK
jgi:quercetin dioxygenase-like cupin family protein